MKDSAINNEEEKRAALVETISSNPRLSHAVFGRFDFKQRGGHFLQEARGLDRAMLTRLFLNESIYTTAFGSHTGGEEFRARVVGGKINDLGQLFVVTFNDRRGDSRPSSHTDYALIISESDVDQIVPSIMADLSILISVFKKVFPQYDRSGGHLIIDPEHPELIPFIFNPLTRT